MPWDRTSEGWILTTTTNQQDEPEYVVWQDNHIKVWSFFDKGTALYRVRIDRRRTYKEVVHQKWIALFFGKNPKMRAQIKGQRLWRDRQIVVHRYGRKPRIYLLVAR